MGLLRRSAFLAAETLRRRPTARLVREMAAVEAGSPAQVAATQARRLNEFCRKAATEVPHYRDLFREAGVGADEIRTPADLASLPFLDKGAIRAAGGRLLHPGGGPFRLTETGGSTGDPLRIHESPLRQSVAVAARIRSRAWWGIRLGDPEIVLFGAPSPRSARGMVRTLKDRVLGSETWAAFGMTPEHLDRVTARIRALGPRHLFGYTSALCALARRIRERTGRDDDGGGGVEVVFTTSEMLLPADRRLLEETFAARVADGYGSKEGGFVAHECPSGRMHLRADTHVVEIVVGDDPVPPPPAGQPGEVGEIVLTHLGDWHWPFIRYRTGDRGRLVGGPCDCGNPLPLIEITGGRITDLLVRRDGALVHGLGAIYPIRETPGVARFFVHQRSRDLVEVTLVVESDYPDDADARIATQLAACLGGPDVRVRHVDSIEQTPSGKYRVVRCDVP